MSDLAFLEFDFGKVSVIDNNILYTEFFSYENFDLAEAKSIDEARHQLSKGKQFYSLVNLVSLFGHMTKKAQFFFTHNSKCYTLIRHEAVIVNTLSIRILVKYFIKFAKPSYKIEVVKNYEDGLKLLQQLATDHDNHNQH